MPTTAILAQGTLIQFDTDPATQTWTTLAEVLSIDGPTLSRDTIDVTNMDSIGAYREFINGLIDPGELTFEINLLPQNATHDNVTGALSFFESGAARVWRVKFPAAVGGTVVDWDIIAVVTQFNVTPAVDTQLRASLALKITGKPTLRNTTGP